MRRSVYSYILNICCYAPNTFSALPNLPNGRILAKILANTVSESQFSQLLVNLRENAWRKFSIRLFSENWRMCGSAFRQISLLGSKSRPLLRGLVSFFLVLFFRFYFSLIILPLLSWIEEWRKKIKQGHGQVLLDVLNKVFYTELNNFLVYYLDLKNFLQTQNFFTTFQLKKFSQIPDFVHIFFGT